MPEGIRRDLDKGRVGTDIATELIYQFVAEGVTNIYLVPPILRGGLRDYRAAQKVLEVSKRL